jgi:4-hydroxyacetophenone monooxygenase
MAYDTIESITDDDETIRAALAEANIPALMCALVHLTGDVALIRTGTRPKFELMSDAQGGIPRAKQDEIRQLAFTAICAWRDGHGQDPVVPDRDTIMEMLNFIIGQKVPDEYAPFLESELSFKGSANRRQWGTPTGASSVHTDAADTNAVPREIMALPAAVRAGFRVVVIGAGMSGILAAIRLKEAGIAFTVIEKNANVGGTWFENRYPGCRVDSPNHTYSYSFAPKDWPQHFSPQGVLLEYFDSIATEYGIRSQIRFETEVKKATFVEASGTWQVEVQANGQPTEVLECNAVITAVGQLNRPRFPDIPGVGSFAGPEFHSARWEPQHDLTGKRVIVIGTGASAFQFVPEIAKQAGNVTIFQRTPPWILPNPQYHDAIPDGKHWLLNHVPFYANWFRFLVFWRTSEGLLARAKRDPSWNETVSVSRENDQLRETLTGFIRSMVGDDPELMAKALPNYPPAGKRMLIDNGNWLRALKRDNVQLVTESIVEINTAGVKTADGTQYDADILVYGTGFSANKFLWPIQIIGKGGKDLESHWQGDPRAYLGISIPGFPNLFCTYGPNTNVVVNGSIIFFSECEVRYILGCVAILLKQHRQAMEPRQDVHDAYNREIDEGNLNMAWGAPNVRSWYKNASGRVTQNWPFSMREFWDRTRVPDPEDFIIY